MASFVPGWEYGLIPEAHARVEGGYREECRRLQGSRLIAVCLRSEFDYDGLTETLELLGGFAAEGEALDYARWEADRRIAAEHSVEARKGWTRSDGEGSNLVGRLIGAAHEELRRVSDGTGCNSVYVSVGIFPAGVGSVIDAALIGKIKHDWELARHFMDVADRLSAGERKAHV